MTQIRADDFDMIAWFILGVIVAYIIARGSIRVCQFIKRSGDEEETAYERWRRNQPGGSDES